MKRTEKRRQFMTLKAKQVEERVVTLTFWEQIKRVDNMELEEISPF